MHVNIGFAPLPQLSMALGVRIAQHVVKIKIINVFAYGQNFQPQGFWYGIDIEIFKIRKSRL